MILRDATEADAPEIAMLLNAIIRETTISFTTTEKTENDVAQDIASRQNAGLPWIIAHGPDGMAGYATAAPFRKGEGYARTLEHSVFVQPDAQRTGGGRGLMHALEARLAARGARSLVAGISAENDTALQFHVRMGFSEVGRIARAGFKFGREIDLVLLQKHLSSASDSR